MSSKETRYICPSCRKLVILTKSPDGHFIKHEQPACQVFIDTAADAFFKRLELATN